MASPVISSSLRRIVVALKTHENSDVVTLAKFRDCIVNYFAPNELSVKVSCWLQEEMLVLSHSRTSTETRQILRHPPEVSDLSSGLDLGTVLLQHSYACPFWKLQESPNHQLIDNSMPNEKGVYVAVAVILESSDSCILMTQRPEHMRAFPKSWTPPGGHLELGEDLIQGCLRELEEETGLKFDPLSTKMRVLGLWESVYPTVLGFGLPKNHHIIVYLHMKSGSSWEKLQSKMKLDPEEVQACSWLTANDVKQLIGNAAPVSTKIKKYVPEPSGQFVTSEFELAHVIPPLWKRDLIMSGTQFALRQWYCQQNIGGHSNLQSKI